MVREELAAVNAELPRGLSVEPNGEVKALRTEAQPDLNFEPTLTERSGEFIADAVPRSMFCCRRAVRSGDALSAMKACVAEERADSVGLVARGRLDELKV